MSIEVISNYLMLFMMIITALFINHLRSLFATVILMGVFSLLSACLFLNMHAVDVAFTEAAVGAGIATLLFLGTLAQTSTSSEEKAGQSFSIFPLLLVSLTGVLLIYGIHDIVPFGIADGPVQTHLAPRYIFDSTEEIGIPNMVTSVLASYRGFDTLGEVTVIFTAGIAILILLGRGQKQR